jgi:uncharacterized protein (DUF1778 family)
MAKASNRKTHRMSVRLTAADLAMIDRAALLRGCSRTDFVREAAVKAAESVLSEQQFAPIPQEGLPQFLDVLAQPAAAVTQLVEVLRRPAPWETRQDKQH